MSFKERNMKEKLLLISSVVAIVLLALAVWPSLAQEPERDGITSSVSPDGPPPSDGDGPPPPMETSTPPTAEPEVEELSIGAEVVERRTATSKHFYLGNGRYQARISAAPIHYRDAEGTWQEIDTTLRPQTKGVYAVEANGLRAYLPARSGGVVKVAGQVYPQAESPPTTLSTGEVGSKKEETTPLLPAATRTLPPVDVSLSWQPVAWRYADAAGSLDDLAAVQPVDGQVEGDTITYEGMLPQVNESYRVIPNGLKHQLTLLGPPRPPAGGLTGDITLDYVGTIELPAGLALYADGTVQAGDFTTNGAIEVRDREGHPLLVLMAPVAYEAENPLEAVGGSYAVWWEGDRLWLAWRTPAAWLLATERRYPVILDPTANIWPPTEDSFMWGGSPDTNYGSLDQFYVGYTPFTARRGLVRWSDLSAIPAYALIDDSFSADVRVWINQTGRGGDDNNSRTVGLYRVTRSWTESGVTWNRYNGTSNWTIPGGDYDSTLLASTSVGIGTGVQVWQNLTLRDVVALWRTNALGYVGEPNYGLLLRYTSETGSEVKWFGSRENSGWKPELDVTYTTGPRALTDQTPVQRRVPSPDYYSIPSSGYWQAVGIRASDSSADYDLRLYSDSNYSSLLDGSYYVGGYVDFVVIDQDAPNATRYPLVYSWDGTGSYQIEYLQRIAYFPSGINPGDSYGPYTMGTSSVIRLWTLGLTAGSENCVSVEPTSGDARLGVAVFAPGTSPNYYFGRSQALAQAVATTGGSKVNLNYTAPSTTGVYGLVVWNESPNTTSSFYLEGCEDENKVFLPIVLKDHRTCSIDNYEPNDTCNQAYGPLTSGQTYQSWISDCDLTTYKKSDYFYIDISTTNPINVYLTNIPAGTDYDLYLYKDPSDDPKDPADKSEGTGSSETISSYSPPATGRYYIRVYGRSGSSTSPYSLRVTYD
jgi:hypothetical protein